MPPLLRPAVWCVLCHGFYYCAAEAAAPAWAFADGAGELEVTMVANGASSAAGTNSLEHDYVLLPDADHHNDYYVEYQYILPAMQADSFDEFQKKFDQETLDSDGFHEISVMTDVYFGVNDWINLTRSKIRISGYNKTSGRSFCATDFDPDRLCTLSGTKQRMESSSFPRDTSVELLEERSHAMFLTMVDSLHIIFEYVEIRDANAVQGGVIRLNGTQSEYTVVFQDCKVHHCSALATNGTSLNDKWNTEPSILDRLGVPDALGSHWREGDLDVSGGGVVSVDMVGGGSLICNFVRSEIHDNNATVGGVLRGVTWSDPYTASQISITVEDSEISNNNAMSLGGVFFALGSNSTRIEVILTGDTAITANKAENGGALATGGSVDIYCNETAGFSYNSAAQNGGDVAFKEPVIPSRLTIDGCSFANSSGVNGGSVHLKTIGGTHAVSSCRFAGCTASDGGSIWTGGGGDLQLYNVTYEQSRAINHGGFIFIEAESSVTMSGSQTVEDQVSDKSGGFDSACSGRGGFAFVGDHGSITVQSTPLVFCWASQGGCIYAAANSSVLVRSVFSGMTNATQGGFVFAEQLANAILEDVQVDLALAVQGGGLAYVSELGTLTLSADCYLQAGSAGRGGMMFLDREAQVSVSNSTLISGGATEGGLIYGGEGAVVTIVGSLMRQSIFDTSLVMETASPVDVMNVSLPSNGGGIRADGMQMVSLAKVQISGFSCLDKGGFLSSEGTLALELHDIDAFGNTAGRGGFAYVGSGQEEAVTTELRCSDATFRSHEALYGGVLYASGSVEATVDSVVFRDGMATDGAGLFIDSQSVVAWNGNSDFVNNSAKDLGGGLHAALGASVTFGGSSRFVGNTAATAGGGIYASFAQISLANTTLMENYAEFGGGAFAFNSRLSASTAHFVDNWSLIGGGLMLKAVPVDQSDGPVVQSNTAEGVGNETTFDVLQLIMENNSALCYGEAISTFGACTVSLAEGIITNGLPAPTPVPESESVVSKFCDVDFAVAVFIDTCNGGRWYDQTEPHFEVLTSKAALLCSMEPPPSDKDSDTLLLVTVVLSVSCGLLILLVMLLLRTRCKWRNLKRRTAPQQEEVVPVVVPSASETLVPAKETLTYKGACTSDFVSCESSTVLVAILEWGRRRHVRTAAAADGGDTMSQKHRELIDVSRSLFAEFDARLQKHGGFRVKAFAGNYVAAFLKLDESQQGSMDKSGRGVSSSGDSRGSLGHAEHSKDLLSAVLYALELITVRPTLVQQHHGVPWKLRIGLAKGDVTMHNGSVAAARGSASCSSDRRSPNFGEIDGSAVRTALHVAINSELNAVTMLRTDAEALDECFPGRLLLTPPDLRTGFGHWRALRSLMEEEEVAALCQARQEAALLFCERGKSKLLQERIASGAGDSILRGGQRNGASPTQRAVHQYSFDQWGARADAAPPAAGSSSVHVMASRLRRWLAALLVNQQPYQQLEMSDMMEPDASNVEEACTTRGTDATHMRQPLLEERLAR